jgi:hypothetical protein
MEDFVRHGFDFASSSNGNQLGAISKDLFIFADAPKKNHEHEYTSQLILSVPKTTAFFPLFMFISIA